MKDLDFDELDRAVNSLMAGVSSSSDSNGRESEPAVEIASSRVEPDVVADRKAAPSDIDAQASPDITRLSAPAARVSSTPTVSAPRRTGRFMDMKHESADMSAYRPLTPPSARPSRYQSDISVLSTSAGQLSNHDYNDRQTTPIPSSFDLKVADNGVVRETATSDDFKEPSTGPVSSSEPMPTESAPVISYDELTELRPNEELRPYSAFIPDAKVEKRPLGGASDEPDGAAEPRSIEPDYESQTPADPAEQLPAELQEDLIAIESGQNTAQTPSVEKPEATGAAETQPAPKKTFDSRPKIESIPTQYASENKQTDMAADSDIFDTDSFAKPLAHPAKSRSGWLKVIFIVGLILLGIGGGLLVYLFVL
jgi:hypothetical protein